MARPYHRQGNNMAEDTFGGSINRDITRGNFTAL